jgi:ADP-ribosylglycohydrolase
MIDHRSRCLGSLLGLAVGDALGTTLEFRPPGSFSPISDMVGGGPFHLKPGQWTDDTSMALCLATSLVERGGFDARDQMDRYLCWRSEGYLSSTGKCFDIGNTVASALRKYERTGDPIAGSMDSMSAGNGSLMRLAPIPLFFASDPRLAIERAADSSRTTHAAREAVDACRYMAGLIVGAVQGRGKEEVLSAGFCPVEGLWGSEPLAPAIAEIADGSFKRKQPPEIQGTGYVVRSLEAALWAFYHAEDFQNGALRAVNLGDDADTTGAIYGQLAGAYYGVESIPASWLDCLAELQLVTGLADRLCSHR